jgi:hypothetical protein
VPAGPDYLDMSKRRKVGVLTFHKCINYGSYWQARCLVEGLRRRGFDAELIDHHCDRVRRAEFRCAFQPMLPVRSSRADMRGYAAKVRKFIGAFAGLPASAPVSLHHPEMADYDTVVVGSDEVWNLSHPWYGGARLFYGDGVNGRRLIAYAGSFGSYSCHWGLDDYWTGLLRGFDALSVRDRNSYWLVNGTTGRDPPLVLDPCLQFPEVVETDPMPDGEPFALVYGHGFPDGFAMAAKRWARRSGVRLRSIGYHNAFADEQMLEAGPLEFAGQMRGASAVITNYFHGCVFALLNRKPFAAAITDYRRNKVHDLAEMLQTQDRIVEEAAPAGSIERLLETPPPPEVYERIGELRRQSGDFLHAALA